MDDWTVKPWKTFAEKAIAFRQDIGAKEHPVIKRGEHPQQWRDWYAYYGWRRMLASQEMMRQKDEKTVPTISPFDFDAEFNPKYPSPEVPREGSGEAKKPMTPEQRERHRQLFPFLRHFGEPAQPTREAAE